MNKRILQIFLGLIVAFSLFLNGIYSTEEAAQIDLSDLNNMHTEISVEKPSLIVDAYYVPVQQVVRACQQRPSVSIRLMQKIILLVCILSLLYLILIVDISRVREIITAATTFSHRTLLSYLHRVDGKRAGFPYCINR